jgi:GlpG protein
MIGHLPSEASAMSFSDYLFVQGIHNEVEPDKEGWAVWIHSEDELSRAKDLLAGFLGDPNDPKFKQAPKTARALRQQAEEEERAAQERFFDRHKVFRSTLPYGVGPLTVVLIAISVAVSVWSWWRQDLDFLNNLFITEVEQDGPYLRWRRGLPEVMHGEIWRLVTPIFLHGGGLHLFFNMIWLFDLGSMIEGRQRTRKLLVLVLVIAAASNFGQYLASGPRFGGMSGVVYGLLGYIWMKGKFDPLAGLFLHRQTVAMMLIWFFVCLAGLIPNVANTAHGVGLILGMAWGFLASRRRA